ncbi:MAG: diguanylate cyclase [Betaproteobacteria bacterium]
MLRSSNESPDKNGIHNRFFRNMSLKVRLSVLSLIVSIPLLIVITTLITQIAATQIRQDANEKLQMLNQKLADTAQIWLDFHLRTLADTTNHPDIVGMEAQRQKPHLERIAAINDHIYLVSTTNLNGKNIARNDDAPLADYHDRQWFIEAKSGQTAFQSLIGRSRGQPALVVAMPIKNTQGKVLGVSMFASYLTKLSQDVHSMQVGKTGYAYVVDAQNRVIAHPDPAYTSVLRNFSNAPAITALRQSHQGALEYTDDNGIVWGAYVSTLENGWGIIVQQQRQEILLPLKAFQSISKIILVCGSMILLIMSIVLIRNALKPVSHLTDTATAIASGDLTRRVTIKNEDEIGLLSKAFNSMTGKLQSIILSQQDQTVHLEKMNTVLEGEIASRKLIEAQLRDLAEIDSLTHISNRRKLDQFLDNEMHRANRFGHPLSLIMLDLDHFKQVNDRHGHGVGDEVLKSVARLVSDSVRDVDLFARYGGEEFVIVCTETDLKGACVLAEKIRQTVENHAFNPVEQVTISLGVAEFMPGESMDSVLKRADEGLYEAKNKGRNRVATTG